MPTISIIIPIYNIENFLSKCIESILKQTFSDFELLLIDDGSTDKSGEICDKYAKEDDRIISIHKINDGVSSARNVGIKNSTGKYIFFSDGDDFIDNDFLEILIASFESNKCQLAICGFQNEFENGEIIYNTKTKNNYLLDCNSAICTLFFDDTYRYQGYIWNKLFLSEIINKFNIFFQPTIYYNEDRLFCFEYIVHCEKVCYSTSVKYHHIFHKNNTMSSMQKSNVFNEKYLTDLDAYEAMRKKIHLFSKYTQAHFWNSYINSSFKIFYLMKNCKYNNPIIFKQLKNIVKKGITLNNLIHIGLKAEFLNLSFIISPLLYTYLTKKIQKVNKARNTIKNKIRKLVS